MCALHRGLSTSCHKQSLTLMQKSLSSLRAVTEAVARAAVLLVVWVRSTEWVPHKRHALSGSAATCCH